MIEVVRYNKEYKEVWDDIVKHSYIDSFIIQRDFIEYHGNRFEDYSLLIFDKKNLSAIFPANKIDHTVCSHQGITYGGLFTKKQISYNRRLIYFNAINMYLRKHGIHKVILKTPPFFYSSNLEQPYVPIMHHNQVTPIHCDAGSFIFTKEYNFPRKCVKKSKLELYQGEYSNDFKSFWEILKINLSDKYNAKPIHSLEEILHLNALFPKNIKLYLLRNIINSKIEAGTVLFYSNKTVKVQYFATTKNGRYNRVSDILYYHIIKKHLKSKDFIDFGTSMDKDLGRVSKKLISTKEKFGISTFPSFSFKYNTSLEFDF